MLKSHDGTAFNLVTFSIVAFDPESGELGVAVATRWPSVGAAVPWVEPGVGAVATQSFTNVDLGPAGLALLREGHAAVEVVRELIAGDPAAEVRQIGVVDAAGRAAAHTGDRCVAEAGHACDLGVSVQGNMLERAEVWPAVLKAFHGADGDLADRLVAALHAGDGAGGDIRGRRSAALLVAPGSPDAQPWARRFDVRVDDSARPVEELACLLRVARAHEALAGALQAADAGDSEAALAGTSEAHELTPDDAQITFWYGLALASSGRSETARVMLETALGAEPRLAELGRRYLAAGHGRSFTTAIEDLPRID